MPISEKNEAIKAFVEKVEAERKEREIENNANVKLKIAVPLIPNIAAIEYERVLADGKNFSDLVDGILFFKWFKKWKGIVSQKQKPLPLFHSYTTH